MINRDLYIKSPWLEKSPVEKRKDQLELNTIVRANSYWFLCDFSLSETPCILLSSYSWEELTAGDQATYFTKKTQDIQWHTLQHLETHNPTTSQHKVPLLLSNLTPPFELGCWLLWPPSVILKEWNFSFTHARPCNPIAALPSAYLITVKALNKVASITVCTCFSPFPLQSTMILILLLPPHWKILPSPHGQIHFSY